MAWREKNTCPLVIGGAGGSGTRVYKAIAEAAGYSMLGIPSVIRFKHFHRHDNLLLDKFFYSKWVNRYVQGELTRFDKMRMRTACRLWLRLTDPLSYGRGRWGWKNPRTRFLIPFFQEMYPGMRFVHVLRDGRDHAFHPRFTYAKHQNSFLSAEEMALPDHLRKALFWSRTHRLTEEMGKEHLGQRYFASRLEDLCADPEKEIARLMGFLGTDNAEVVQQAARLVHMPDSMGRWHTEPQQRIDEVEQRIGEDLLHYGYPLHADVAP